MPTRLRWQRPFQGLMSQMSATTQVAYRHARMNSGNFACTERAEKMAIQFHCPQGHLLQGEEAHMGMQTQCPYCGIMFIIPVIDPHALQAAYGMQGGAAYAPQQESYLPGEMQEIYDPTATQPGLRDFLGQVAAGEVAEQPHPEQPHGVGAVDYESASVALQDGGTPGCVHIPCPNGHELETPFDMLGQEVLCPHCGSQFRLRNEDSREYLEKLEKRERERGKFWFNWAVTAAILIGGGLLVMVAVALSK